MDEKQKLMGMMLLAEEQQKAAEEQQKAVDAAVAALNERQAALDAAIKSIHEAALNAAKSAEKGARSGASDAASNGIASATTNASETLKRAVTASTQEMTAAAQAAQSSACALQDAEKSLKVRWVLIAALTVLCCICAFLGASSLFTAWHEYKIKALQVERSQLVAEVERLAEIAADLKQKGGKAKLSTCDGRLCVQVDANAPRYQNDYFILKGY